MLARVRGLTAARCALRADVALVHCALSARHPPLAPCTSTALLSHPCQAGLTPLLLPRPPRLQSNWGYNLGSNDWQGPTGYIQGKSIDPLMGRRWEEIQVRVCCKWAAALNCLLWHVNRAARVPAACDHRLAACRLWAGDPKPGSAAASAKQRAGHRLAAARVVPADLVAAGPHPTMFAARGCREGAGGGR